MFYPGVPLRKLYKRYSTKLEKHKAVVITGEGMQLIPENNMQARDGEKNQKKLGCKEGEQEAENKHLVGKIAPNSQARSKPDLVEPSP